MRTYWLEVKTEILKLARMRAYLTFTVMFPLMFYCFFGLAMGHNGPANLPSMAQYLLATYGAFAVIGATLYAFGVGVAVERGLGWRQLKLASPMPEGAYLVAKTAVSLFFGAIVVALLFGLGASFGGVRMDALEWLKLGGTLLAGAVPFCALGLAIGSSAGPNSASAVVNMVYMPLAFLGGLWIPYDVLPAGMKLIAPFTPTYHFAQLALASMGAPTHGAAIGHVEALVAFALIFGGAAWMLSTRESEKMYG